jgi:hypothetical protein
MPGILADGFDPSGLRRDSSHIHGTEEAITVHAELGHSVLPPHYADSRLIRAGRLGCVSNQRTCRWLGLVMID